MWLHNLNELQMLLAVHEAGSFTEAARKLDLSTSALSAGVRRLETELGVRLLRRSTRSLRTTTEGDVLLEHARRALDLLAQGRDQSRMLGGALAGRLSVATTTMLGTYFLADWLAGFASRHPAVQLQLGVGDGIVDLVRAQVDVCVRNGPLEDSDLSARPLADVAWIACASPAYLTRRGVPHEPAELAQHDCITHLVRSRFFDRWAFHPKSGGDAVEVNVGGPLSTDNAAIAVHWALSGQGVIYQSSLALRGLIDDKALVPLFGAYRGRSVPLYAVYPARRLVPLRVQRMVDELSEAITSAAA